MPKSIANSIFLNECSALKILQIINELENGKSSDKTGKFYHKSNFSLHFNYLIKIGKFPDTLKK